MTNHGENSIVARIVCKFPAGPEVVVWDHGMKNKDNVMISDMFLYVIMLNLLRESYALHAIQLWMIICVVTVWNVWAHLSHTVRWQMARVICRTMRIDGGANYSSQVLGLHVAYIPISGSYFSRCIFLKGIFKCLIPLWLGLLLAHCAYSWPGTTPGPQRSWAESSRLYSWHGTTPGPWHRSIIIR